MADDQETYQLPQGSLAQQHVANTMRIRSGIIVANLWKRKGPIRRWVTLKRDMISVANAPPGRKLRPAVIL
jgi:hypothetical protein